jgi:hypothetical protein
MTVIVNVDVCSHPILLCLFIGASHQVSGHLAKQFQGRRFLEIDQSETIIACGGHVC